MHVTDYITKQKEIQGEISILKDTIGHLYDMIEIPDIDKLRPATAEDVVVGAVFYYPLKSMPYFQIIESVRYPDDDWKAYVAEDGCRYGLHGAYCDIEVPS